jgi:hypothetical protein
MVYVMSTQLCYYETVAPLYLLLRKRITSVRWYYHDLSPKYRGNANVETRKVVFLIILGTSFKIDTEVTLYYTSIKTWIFDENKTKKSLTK